LCSVIDCGTDVYNTRQVFEKLLFQCDFSPTQNLITMSLNWTEEPWGPNNWRFVNGRNQTEAYLFLGVEQSGTDPKGLIRLVIYNETQKTTIAASNTSSIATLSIPTKGIEVMAVDYTKLTTEDIMQLATGYTTENLWLKWIMNTAKEHNASNCIASASARLQLFTEPSPLYPNDTWGYNCMIRLTHEASPINCTTLASIFPPVSNKIKTGAFTPFKGKGNYTCFNHTSTDAKLNIGNIDLTWCTKVKNGRDLGPWGRAGLYHSIIYCGDQRLLIRIPPKTVGVCALVRLGAPLALISPDKTIPIGLIKPLETSTFDLTLNSPTYLDAIIIIIHKKVEYALCLETCCTFIPNNTAPDGTVTKALQGLRILSKQMHEDSSVNNFLDDWFTGMFGKWKGILLGVFTALLTMLSIFALCGCCCIPCIRSLCVRAIDTAVSPTDPAKQMLVIEGEANDADNDEGAMLKHLI
uniref:Uncharacterized protein n=1 Tax=Cynoglossus semilaevis TaxID=244447 RepID=A0A3P8VDI6_CYNSE